MKRSHIYTGDRGHILNLQVSKGKLNLSQEWPTHLLASLPLVLLSPGRTWLQVWAVSIGEWSCSAQEVLKGLAARYAAPGSWGLCGWVESMPSLERKFSKVIDFPLLTFCLSAENAYHWQTCRPDLLRRRAGRSSLFQWDKCSGWVLNCSCMSVRRAGCACFSHDQEQSWRLTEVTPATQGWLGLTFHRGRVTQETARLERWLEENTGIFWVARSRKASLI